LGICLFLVFLVVVNKLVHLPVLVCVCLFVVGSRSRQGMGASARKDKKKKKKKKKKETCRKARPDEFVTTSLPRLSPPFGEEVFFFFFSLGLLRVLRFTHVVLPCSVTLGSRWEREREEDTMVRVLSCQGDLRHLAYAFFARACCNGSLLL